MKKYIYLLILGCFFFIGCQTDEKVASNNMGYLQLKIGEDKALNSRIASGYDPKQLAVQILNAKGQVMKSTDNWEKWKDTPLELEAGTYTIQASSNGFDGTESGFSIPYYVGSTSVDVVAERTVDAVVKCTLANVKVTVNYASELLTALKDGLISVEVGPLDETKCSPLTFAKGDTREAYFPATDLYMKVTVVSSTNRVNTLRKELTKVAARDHYRLNLKLSESGNGVFNVTVNDKVGFEMNYEFIISPKPTTTASISSNAWSKFAILEAEEITMASGETVDAAKVKFEYRKEGVTDWTSVDAVTSETGYSATVKGLTSSMKYEYQLNYNEGEFTISDTFTTESGETLPNSGFEYWHQSSGTWYPMPTSDDLFWDTSNPGSSIALKNVTTKNENIKHGGNASAELKSTLINAVIMKKFAAASLYSGEYGETNGMDGATINFGRIFTARPVALKGFFQYAPKTIDSRGDNTPDEAGIIKGTTMDMCDIYVALTKKVIQIDNTKPETLDWKNSSDVIAYGELPKNLSGSTNNAWQEFNIPLIYNDLAYKANEYYIIIVASSSKYGDYFTGGNGSVMYLDDLELDYEGTPQTK